MNCSNDDDSSTEPASEKIIGEWQLKKLVIVGVAGTFEQIYNPNDVVYKFNANGTLEIISIISEYTSGTMNYKVELDCLSDFCAEDEPKYELLFIEGSKNELVFETNNKFQYGKGHVDGSSYVLERLR